MNEMSTEWLKLVATDDRANFELTGSLDFNAVRRMASRLLDLQATARTITFVIAIDPSDDSERYGVFSSSKTAIEWTDSRADHKCIFAEMITIERMEMSEIADRRPWSRRQGVIRHPYWLRPALKIVIELPNDMTAEEADWLSYRLKEIPPKAAKP